MISKPFLLKGRLGVICMLKSSRQTTIGQTWPTQKRGLCIVDHFIPTQLLFCHSLRVTQVDMYESLGRITVVYFIHTLLFKVLYPQPSCEGSTLGVLLQELLLV